MSKKRLLHEVNKLYKEKTDLKFPYTFLLNKHIVSVMIYDKLFLQFIVGENYPFRPPEVLIHDNELINYLKWCATITGIINSRKFLSQQAIINAHFFSINTITNTIVPTFPLPCICCNSILCITKWTPAFLFINIIDEAIYYKKLLFYTSKVGQKLISLLFNKWPLSDDLILHIFSFMNYGKQ